MRVRYLLSFLPSNNLEDAPAYATTDDPERVTDALTHLVPDRAAGALRHARGDPRTSWTTGEFLEVFPFWATNIVTGFARLDGRSVGVIANQPKVLAGTLDIDASEKASAVRAVLRRVQHPDPHLRRRAGVPAGHDPGVQRDHPARRQAALRVRGGDRAADDGDHAQGLRRRVPRHELEAPARRRVVRVADGRDRGDGRRGSGQHRVPQGDRGGR